MSFFTENCLTPIDSKIFGIEDSEADKPASISINNKSKWLAQVNNPNELNLNFYAIDNCIIYYDEQGNKKSSCDAAIQHTDEKLIFIELKYRKSSGWLGKGVKQLKSTLQLYLNNQANKTKTIECYVCNSQRPSAPTTTLGVRKKFKQETGYKLTVNFEVDI